MNYEFKASETFWRAYHRLTPFQRINADVAFEIFRRNPFDPRLGIHKIERLSARLGRTVYSVILDADLRAVFFMKGNVICSFDIGTHEIYKK